MKTMTPLQRSTVQMSVGVAILTAITEVIYVILCLALPSLSYTWKFTAGNIFMAGIMCVNFYLMARGIYHAVDMGDEEYARRQIRLSHTVRSIVFVLALVSCFLLGYGFGPHSEFRYESGIAACISVLYPQLTIFALRMSGKIGTDEPATVAAGAAAPTEDADAPTLSDAATHGAVSTTTDTHGAGDTGVTGETSPTAGTDGSAQPPTTDGREEP